MSFSLINDLNLIDVLKTIVILYDRVLPYIWYDLIRHDKEKKNGMSIGDN